MGEMREWWANVYPNGKVGPKSDDPEGLYGSQRGAAFSVHVRLKPEWWALSYPVMGGRGGIYPKRDWAVSVVTPLAVSLVHIRLKPVGAPRRYASEFERMMWDRGFTRRAPKAGLRQSEMKATP